MNILGFTIMRTSTLDKMNEDNFCRVQETYAICRKAVADSVIKSRQKAALADACIPYTKAKMAKGKSSGHWKNETKDY